MSRRVSAALALVAVVLPAATVVGCAAPERGEAPPQQAQQGSPDRGKEMIVKYGCGTCHEIPGVDGADGLVGPPLSQMARRSYIAGELANSEDNMHRWIRDPQAVEPGTAMPDLGVTAQDAADITAYLYTLR
jgi:cytochrome c2